MRLHVRAIIRDGTSAFMGSQSLRKLELDGRREVGVIIRDSRVARQMRGVFDADWAQTPEAVPARDQDTPGTAHDDDREKATSGA
jgi:hypothetical protein